MKQIEAGMLVQIVNTPRLTEFEGHIGLALRPCDVYQGSWDIEGAEHQANGRPISFHENNLKPIEPPEEDEASWEKIEDLTSWKPPVKELEHE